jgi:hypothetical protein
VKRFALLIGTLTLLVAGCGSDNARYANITRPPEQIVVSAAVTAGGITVSPSSFGAGLVQLVVTNLTKTSQQVTLEEPDSGASAGETPPINPQEIAQIKVNLTRGKYQLTATDPTISPAPIKVGPARAPEPDTLQQP